MLATQQHVYTRTVMLCICTVYKKYITFEFKKSRKKNKITIAILFHWSVLVHQTPKEGQRIIPSLGGKLTKVLHYTFVLIVKL